MNRIIICSFAVFSATAHFPGQANAEFINASVDAWAGTRIEITHSDIFNTPLTIERKISGPTETALTATTVAFDPSFELIGPTYSGSGSATSELCWVVTSWGGFVVWVGGVSALAAPDVDRPVNVKVISVANRHFSATGTLTESSLYEWRESGISNGIGTQSGSQSRKGDIRITTPFHSGNVTGTSSVWTQGLTSKTGSYSKSWTFNGIFPGVTTQNGIPPVGPAGSGNVGPFNSPAIAAGVAAQGGISVDGLDLVARTDLAVPFVAPVWPGGTGDTELMYFDPELAIGYGYSIGEGNSFKSFQIPDPLPLGDDTFSIYHDGTSYPLTAGQEFDFTTIDPLGVDSFLLLGIDETELIELGGNAHPPFVFGMTFTDPSVATFSTYPLTAVPEPSTLALAAFGMIVMGCRRRKRL